MVNLQAEHIENRVHLYHRDEKSHIKSKQIL